MKKRKKLDNYRKRYILLKIFLRAKQQLIIDILSAGLLKKKELSPPRGECFLDYLYLKVEDPNIRERIRSLILMREEILRMWFFEIARDTAFFEHLDPSGVSSTLAKQKFRQALDSAGGYEIDGELSVKMLKMRIDKDMERIRKKITPESYFVSRKESYENAADVSEEILVEYATPEDWLIAKESGAFWLN